MDAFELDQVRCRFWERFCMTSEPFRCPPAQHSLGLELGACLPRFYRLLDLRFAIEKKPQRRVAGKRLRLVFKQQLRRRRQRRLTTCAYAKRSQPAQELARRVREIVTIGDRTDKRLKQTGKRYLVARRNCNILP